MNKGYSLIEVLVALLILGIAASGLFRVQGWAEKVHQISRERKKQKRLFHNEFQKLSALGLLNRDTIFVKYSYPCEFEFELTVMDSTTLESMGYLPELNPFLFSRSAEYSFKMHPQKVRKGCKDTLNIYGVVNE